MQYMKMSMYILVVIGLFGTSFCFPMVKNPSFNGSFAYPNERTNGFITGRITGGQEAQPHAYPYQVGLYCNTDSSTYFCGGSLVSPNYVLTAAHCLDGKISVDLIFGAHEIEKEESTQILQTSTDFIVHSDWDDDLLTNDIALVKLPTPIQENDYIKVIKVTSANDSYVGEKGSITGWGVKFIGQLNVTPVLMYYDNDILSNEDCKSIHPFETVIESTHLCLSGVSSTGNVGACKGDSGGPLVVDGIQVGVDSFGYTNCESGKPSVFTRLTEFTDWIRANSDVDI